MKTNLKDKLINIVNDIEMGMSDKLAFERLISIIHEEYKENMLMLFIQIQELDRKKLKDEKQLLYSGLEESMHNTSSLAKHLLEDKNSRQAKEYAEYLFENFEGNIAMLINTMKAYFPNGKSDGASNNGKWFYDKFAKLLIKNKNKYLPGGDSYNWVEMFEHEEYINLILNNNEQDKLKR